MWQKKTNNDENNSKNNNQTQSERVAADAATTADNRSDANDQPPISGKMNVLSSIFGRAHKPSRRWAIALICLLALGAAGAGLKIWEETARRQNAAEKATVAGERLASPNAAPVAAAAQGFTPPYPVKEYIYAGSRMLAVEEPGLTPTVAPATLSGHVSLNSKEHELIYFEVQMTDANGSTRSSLINSSGDYSFTGVTGSVILRLGERSDLIIQMSPWKATPTARFVNAVQDEADLDFVIDKDDEDED